MNVSSSSNNQPSSFGNQRPTVSGQWLAGNGHHSSLPNEFLHREHPPVWNDPSAAHRRKMVERHLTCLRWIVIAGATIYLVFVRQVDSLYLAGAAILFGLAFNGLLTWLFYHNMLSTGWSVIAQIVDIALLIMYTAALPGGLYAYLPLFTTTVITAMLRFGMPGALVVGPVGMVLGLLTSGPAPSSLVVVATIGADTLLLAYMGYLFCRLYHECQKRVERLQERTYEINVLHEVSTTVHDLKSEDALQNIVEITTKVLGFQRAALFLTPAVGDTLPHAYYSSDPEAQRAGLPKIHLDRELFEAVLQKDTPVVVDGSQGLPEMSRRALLQVAVPLHGHEAPIGVLIADRNNRGVITQADKDKLSSLAKSAVMAIENASLHRRIRQLANHDGLTGVFNHRYFQEALRARIAESEGKWPTSLLMIEIDRFKKYNDTFGHRQGDMALINLSRALEEASSPWRGLVARYGGDEFVVILERVGRRERETVARAIQERACQIAGQALQAHNLPVISLSVGVATFPDDALNAADLIDAADRAMYVVKRSGGNNVRAYSRELMVSLSEIG